MYSKKETTQDVCNFMESLGFSSFEDSEVMDKLLERFKGKVVNLKKMESKLLVNFTA